jgi:hypothetical protein
MARVSVGDGMLISTRDTAAAWGCAGDELTAGQAAQTELRAIGVDEPIEAAALVMAPHWVEHLVAIDPASGHVRGACPRWTSQPCWVVDRTHDRGKRTARRQVRPGLAAGPLTGDLAAS